MHEIIYLYDLAVHDFNSTVITGIYHINETSVDFNDHYTSTSIRRFYLIKWVYLCWNDFY